MMKNYRNNHHPQTTSKKGRGKKKINFIRRTDYDVPEQRRIAIDPPYTVENDSAYDKFDDIFFNSAQSVCLVCYNEKKKCSEYAMWAWWIVYKMCPRLVSKTERMLNLSIG